jgi:hypothetical protein
MFYYGMAWYMCDRLARKGIRAVHRPIQEDAIENMTVIDAIYRAAGLPLRKLA